MLDHPLKDIIISQVITIPVSGSLSEAKRLMTDHKIHHLPVVDGNRLVGILSQNDIRKVEFLSEFIGDKTSSRSVFESIDISELMTKDIVSLEEDSSIGDAVRLFSQHTFQALPITRNSEIVGIVVTRDIFRMMTRD